MCQTVHFLQRDLRWAIRDWTKVRGRFEQDHLYIGIQGFGYHQGEIGDIFLVGQTFACSIWLVDAPHFYNTRAEQKPMWLMSEDVGIKAEQHLSRAISSNPRIEEADIAFRVGQMNAVLENGCPTTIL